VSAKTRWWYLSYVKDERFVGACIVRGGDFLEAVASVGRLGVSPGGQILGVPVPEEEFPGDAYTYRLLSKEEIKACWGDAASIAEHKKSDLKKDRRNGP
jgi:hypothetical protein